MSPVPGGTAGGTSFCPSDCSLVNPPARPQPLPVIEQMAPVASRPNGQAAELHWRRAADYQRGLASADSHRPPKAHLQWQLCGTRHALWAPAMLHG